MGNPIRVLVADDQELVRKGIVALLSSKEDISIVGEAAHGNEAIALTDDLCPDVVLMDIRMPACDGISATKKIRQSHPSIKILIMTTFDDADLVVQALNAGASGYFLKRMPSAQIAKAIRIVFDGNMFLGFESAAQVVEQLSKASDPQLKAVQRSAFDVRQRLSDCELEILKLIGQGKNNKEISNAVNMSEGTVKNYVSRIFTKIDARDRIQAALIAQSLL